MTRHRTTHPAAVNLEDMNHEELLREYNTLSPTKRNAMFKSKGEAIARINALRPPPATPEVALPEVAPTAEVIAAEVVTPAVEVPAKKSVVKFTQPKKDSYIKILTEGGANPRRPGTDAHRHFEALKSSGTIREYLEKFPLEARNTARRWAYNCKVDGFIALLDEPEA